VLVILVPVFFGFMGFAIDLGRLYLARGEVKAAANAMALAAAQKLTGTDAALTNAQAAAQFMIEDSGGYANKYDFGAVPIGVGSSRLVSVMPEPQFFATVGSATEAGDATGESAGATTAKHVRVDIRAQAPLTFWGFLSLGQARVVDVAARAVAGVSAPVCQACGIDPVAMAPLNADDTTDFGFAANARYTLYFNCTQGNLPTVLAGTEARVPYVLIDRYNTEATLFSEEGSQAFRIGAGGLPGDTNRTRACIQVNNTETIWASAAPGSCTLVKPVTVQNWECGLATRFDSALATNCETIQDSANIASAYTPDSDLTDLDDYAAYTGNLRRILTVAIVDQITDTTAMTVLGFRQFLLQPNQGGVNLDPSERNGKFVATYIGYPVPLKQGYMGGCGVASGPGKVVLHQ
jgi:Flp pilus assembly protein TadG